MKATIKRLLALILAMAMSLSLLSAGVWATDLSAESSEDASVTVEEEESAPEAEKPAPAEEAEEPAPAEEPEAEASAPGEDLAPEEAPAPEEEAPEAEESAPAEEDSLTAQYEQLEQWSGEVVLSELPQADINDRLIVELTGDTLVRFNVPEESRESYHMLWGTIKLNGHILTWESNTKTSVYPRGDDGLSEPAIFGGSSLDEGGILIVNSGGFYVEGGEGDPNWNHSGGEGMKNCHVVVNGGEVWAEGGDVAGGYEGYEGAYGLKGTVLVNGGKFVAHGGKGSDGTVQCAVTDTIMCPTGTVTYGDSEDTMTANRLEEAMTENGGFSVAPWICCEVAVQQPEEHKHDDLTFTPWTSTDSLPTSEGSYCLTADVTLSDSWTVPSGTVSLCLNGFGIRYQGTENKRVISVPKGASLNLYDCGTTEHKYTVNDFGRAVVDDSGSQTFTGGYITGGSLDNYGAGVYANGGTFHMYKGTIIGNSAGLEDGGGVAVDNGGTFIMEGGSILCNTSFVGGGVGVLSGTFEVSGASTIINNMGVGKNTSNVYLYENCTINIRKALDSSAKIGVAMQKPGVFTKSTGVKAVSYMSSFSSDKTECQIQKAGDELKLFKEESSDPGSDPEPTPTSGDKKQSAPAAPRIKSVTVNSITVVKKSGEQYSLDGKKWQNSNVFKGLKPNTSYKVYARKAARTGYKASPASKATTTKTKVAKKTNINNGLFVSETGGVLTLTYGEVTDADRYEVYLCYCGTNIKKTAKVVATVKGAQNTTAKVTKYRGKKLNRKRSYTVWVVAKKGKKTLKTSDVVHAAGSLRTDEADAVSVSVEKPEVTLAKGKTTTIHASVRKAGKGKLHSSSKIAKYRYSSRNKKVATVNKKGKITAVGKGTCKIKVMVLNGLCCYVTVTVK